MWRWEEDLAGGRRDYVALVIAGGHAPEYIRNDEDCLRIMQQSYGDSKPVAQLCHGPLVAAAACVLNGRRTSAYLSAKLSFEDGWSGGCGACCVGAGRCSCRVFGCR